MADKALSPKQLEEQNQKPLSDTSLERHDQDATMDDPAAQSDNEPEVVDDSTELHAAARNIDLESMQRLLEPNSASVNINAKTSENGHTPLWDLVSAAVEYDEMHDDAVACLTLLISHGANVNAQANNGATPLHRCAFSWCHDTSVEMAKVLLEHDADPNANKTLKPEPTPESDSQAVTSTAHDHEEDGCECGGHIGTVLKAAYKQATGGQTLELPEQAQEKLVTPLHLAVGRNANLPMARLLLTHGAKVNINDPDAGTPLHLAVAAGSEAKNLEIITLLLSQHDAASLVSVPNAKGYLPIHLAAESYSCSFDSVSHEIMVALLGAGSPVDVPLPDTHPRENRRGLTPLLLVAQNSQLSPHPSSSQDAEPDVEHNPPLKTITHLVSLGADPTIQGALNQSALFFAILASNLPLVKYLSTLPKVDLSFIKTTESKPLHAAALSSNPDLITFLVKTANCPINEPDSEGYTALIHAAGYAKPDSSANQVGAVLQASTIKTLVSLGADTEASISDGRRALHFAAFKGQVACLSELIRQGADISAVDDNHWTALHFAARYHHPECIKILLDNGRGKKNLIGQVVNGGPRPKYKDGNEIDITGFNAADLARSVRGGEETVALLIKYGEVLSQKTRDLEDDELWEEKGSSQCCVM